MATHLALIALVVKDYDAAIAWYTEKLNFILIEDTPINEQKRWVVIAPGLISGSKILLAKAVDEKQTYSVGNQTGGRVFLFLNTDDFEADYNMMISKGVKFVREPLEEAYGKVAVFEDLYGNLWDLIEPA